MDFQNQKLKDFLKELGSKKGAPGGGAAAALAASAGAALVEMVARLNDARFKKTSGSAAQASLLRKRMQGMMQKDARAFKKIKAAYKTRVRQPHAWQRALKEGAETPFEICESSRKAAHLAEKEKSRTSDWLESDRLEALVLLRAAFESARLNVEINLREIKDTAFVNSMKGKLRWQ